MAGGVKVRDVEGNELEVSADEAQAGFAAGQFELADEKVRVVRGDNRTGYVERGNVAAALAQGWTIGTEGEAAAKQLRREASGVVGTTVGGVEAVARGASMGISDAVLAGLGADEEAMQARQEALGGIGTGLEVGGALAATAFTGGGSAAAQAGIRGGGVAARLAGGAARLTAAPSRIAARAGTAVERAIVGQAEASAGRRIVGQAAGEAIDGALGGLGGAVSENVLHDKELTAEALLGGALAGAAFGGGVGGAVGAGSATIGRVLSGARALRGGDVGDDAMRRVLGRDLGIEPVEIPDALVEAARNTDESVLGRLAERLAPLNGSDPAIAKRVYTTIHNEPKWARDVFNRKGQIEQEVAEGFKSGLERVRGALDVARLKSGGEAKYNAAAAKLPRNADLVSPRITEELRAKLETRIAEMERANETTFARSYDVGAVREARALVKRAFEESLPARAAGEARPKLHGQESEAVASFRAMDRLKRDLAEQIKATGGWGAPRMGTTTDTIAANKELRSIYDEVKVHLEREDLWGGAGQAQREINAKFAASARAEAALREGAKGSGISGLYNSDGSVNLRQAMTLARQYQRMGGGEVVDKLDEVLETQLDYLRTVSKHYDLGDDGKAAIRDAEAAVKELRDGFANQAKAAAFLSDAESLREAESNRSVSMGAASTLGPAVGGLLGLSVAGPVGAAAGAVAGGVMRPYSTARSMASLLAMTGSFGKKLDGGRLVTRLRARAKAVAGGRVGERARDAFTRAREEARAAGRSGVRAAAFQIGEGSPKERAEKAERIERRVVEMSSPDSIRRAMGPELEALAVGAPETAAAIEQAVQRAAAYLAASAPKIVKNPFSGRPPHVNPRELDRWLLRRAAVVSPAGVVDRIVDGTATREEVECLRHVYPKHYQALVEGVLDAVAETADRDPLPHATLVSLGRLLEQPLSEELSTQRIAAAQALFGPAGAPAPEQQIPAPSSGPDYRPAAADAINSEGLRTRSQSVGTVQA